MEENSAPTNLHEILAQETETKAPSAQKSKMWSFDEEEPSENETTEQGSSSSSGAKSKPDTAEDKLKNQKASAETLTAMLDIVGDMGGNLVLDIKFRNKFTDEQFDRAQEIQDTPIDQLTGDDLTLRNKFDRLNKKRKEKSKELPLEGDDTERLNRTFLNYYKITGKEMGPEVLMYLGITQLLLSKARVIFMD